MSLKERDFKKRETVVEDIVGLVMTTSQLFQDPTLTQIGASARAWKERYEATERMELRGEVMASRGGVSSNLNEFILLNNNELSDLTILDLSPNNPSRPI